MKSMKWRKLLAFTTLLTIGTASCSKPENEHGTNTDVKELLVGKKWQIVSERPETAADFNGDGVPDNEFHQFAQDCELDNYTIYTGDGFAKDYEGAEHCTETPPVKYQWEVKENNSIIKIIKSSVTYLMKIISINENVLVVSMPYSVSGITVNVTITYKKI